MRVVCIDSSGSVKILCLIFKLNSKATSEVTQTSWEVGPDPWVTLDENLREKKNREDVIVLMIWGLGPSIVKLGHCATISATRPLIDCEPNLIRTLVLSDVRGVRISYVVLKTTTKLSKLIKSCVLKVQTLSLNIKFGTKTNHTANMVCVCPMSGLVYQNTCPCWVLHGWWARWVYDVWPAALVSVSGKVFKMPPKVPLPGWYNVSIWCVQK